MTTPTTWTSQSDGYEEPDPRLDDWESDIPPVVTSWSPDTIVNQ